MSVRLDDEDDRLSPQTTQRKKINFAAKYKAQTNGGDWERLVEELTPDGKTFDDRFLTQAGYKRAAIYEYTAPDGFVLYESLKYVHEHIDGEKTFVQRREAVGVRRAYVFGAGLLRVPYRWPDLAADKIAPVYLCEGEKDADRVASLDLVATTISGGKHMSDTILEALRDRDVIILQDNDEAGRKLAADRADKLRGVARSVRAVQLPGLPHKGDVSDWLDANHTKDELVTFANAQPIDDLGQDAYQVPDEAVLPQREYLYGQHLMRKMVSVTAGAGGTGKSAMKIAKALAMASGKPLLGDEVSRPLRVLLMNLEDDRARMDERIVAAMKHYGLRNSDLGDRLFVIAKGEFKMKITSPSAPGTVKRNEAVIDYLIKYLRDHAIDVFMFDPLRKMHTVSENDNVMMGEVIEILEGISEAANVLVDFTHHTRKGNGDDASIDSVRGASSIVDAPRSCDVVEKMTKADAKALGIEEARRRFYFKRFNGKINFTPPVDQVAWLEIKSVQLDNGGMLIGDSIGVVTRWYPVEAAAAALTPYVVDQIKAKVGTEPRWREYPTAEMWVGKAVGPLVGLDPDDNRDAVKVVIKRLIKDGVLTTVQAPDAHRLDKTFVVVAAP
jgi:AAA domain/Toprim-like